MTPSTDALPPFYWTEDGNEVVDADVYRSLHERLEAARHEVSEYAAAVRHASDLQDEAEVRAEAAERALTEIETTNVDWTKGVDENCERLKAIARAAFAPADPWPTLPKEC